MMDQVTTASGMIEPPVHYPRSRTVAHVRESQTIEEVQQEYHLFDGAAKTGLHLLGGPGCGKSRFLGRGVAWNTIKRRKPLVVLDPTGGTIDNVLDKVVRLPLQWRERCLQHILYIDIGAKDVIVPTPLFYRLQASESLEEIVNRILVVWESLDPWLESAPVMGKNSLEACGSYGGQITAALGLQLDFVTDLVRYTKQYESLLGQVRREYPDLKDAVHYFYDLTSASRSEREHNTSAFLRKARMFLTDPAMKATFCAPQPGFDWDNIVRQGIAVLVDFRGELDHRRRQFKLLWWLKYLMAFIQQRGMAGRDQEVTLIVDEVTQLLGYQTLNGQSVLAQDIEELTTVFGRNYGVNVVIAHQGLAQVDPRIQNALMQMGSQMVGRLSNPDDALLVAKQFKNYDPEQVRKKDPIWMSVEKSERGSQGPYSYRVPTIIDYRSTEYTPEQQYILFADRLRQLPQFQFLLRPALTEGQLSDARWLIDVDTEPGVYPHEPYIAAFRQQIRAGQSVDELLQKIDQRKPPAQAPTGKKKDKKKELPQHGTIGGRTAHEHRGHSLPGTTTSLTQPVTGTTPQTQDNDESDPWH